MAFSSCLSLPSLPLKPIGSWRNVGMDQRLTCSHKSLNSELSGQRVAGIGTGLRRDWNILGGSRVIIRPQVETFIRRQKASGIQASWPFYWEHLSTSCSSLTLSYKTTKLLGCLPTWMFETGASFSLFPLVAKGIASSQIASTAFTLGTAAVLPFYTLMVCAPNAELTKKTMQSSIPYIVLGLLYGYLLFLSWTPDTLRLMFASKYWLPELSGIAKMFSSEMTLASAWIHLMAVDLFAARQVFHDGIKNKIETRHSVSFCLLFCPIGIITHFITKALTKSTGLGNE